MCCLMNIYRDRGILDRGGDRIIVDIVALLVFFSEEVQDDR